MSNSAAAAFNNRAGAALRLLRRSLVRGGHLLLPQHCELCAAPARHQLICPACVNALPRIAEACPRCGLPAAGGLVCGSCLAHPPPFDATIAAYAYAFPVDRLLQALKYGGRLALADWAAAALGARVANVLDTDSTTGARPILVPLPLAPARQRQRGFNQAQAIASCLASTLDLGLAHILERPHLAPAQAGLPWAERRKNVRGAFVARHAIAGGHYALVDDVMTTGATLAEAARALKTAGAARVDCWIVARTLPPGQS